MGEELLAMAQRHVAEGAERIERQTALIAELERDGHAHMLPQARALLAEMHTMQTLSEDHLAREAGRQEGHG